MGRVWIPMPKDMSVEEWVAYLQAFHEAQLAQRAGDGRATEEELGEEASSVSGRDGDAADAATTPHRPRRRDQGGESRSASRTR